MELVNGYKCLTCGSWNVGITDEEMQCLDCGNSEDITDKICSFRQMS